MYKEFDIILLASGEKGTIVHIYPDNKSYEIEISYGECGSIIRTVEENFIIKTI